MKPRKWNKEQLVLAVASSTSYRQVLNKLGLRPAGGNYTQIKKYIIKYKINNKHFKGQGWNSGLKGLLVKPRIPLEDILVKNNNFQSHKLKNRLFKSGLKLERCEECGWCKRNNIDHSPLELHHINGERLDNRIDNLQILCPNCHSLKPSHRGRNIK